MGGIYWIASYPKSGNTWLRIFIRNLIEDGAEPVDINDVGPDHIASSRVWLDELLAFDTADLTADELEALRPDAYDWASGREHPGYHKIHDARTFGLDGRPLNGSVGTLGALYIVRDPLDVAPSLASHWDRPVDEVIAVMGRDDAVLARDQHATVAGGQVRQRLLSWSGHVRSWVDAPGLRRQVVRYEDLLHDPRTWFGRCAAFLGLPCDPERVERAVRASSFEVCASQEAEKGFVECPHHAADRFFRRGEAGGWRAALSDEQASRIVADHGDVMRRFGYLDRHGRPVWYPPSGEASPRRQVPRDGSGPDRAG